MMIFACRECIGPCFLTIDDNPDEVFYPPKKCPVDGEDVDWVRIDDEGVDE